MEVNVHEAKTHLSRLLKRVAAGEEITIARAGVPVARLIAAAPAAGERPMGMDRDKIRMSEDFDKLDPETEALFYTPLDLGVPVRPASPARKVVRKKQA